MAITSASLLTRLEEIGKQSNVPEQAALLEELIKAETPAACEALIRADRTGPNSLGFPPEELLGDDLALDDGACTALKKAALEARISMGLRQAIKDVNVSLLQSVLQAKSLPVLLKTLKAKPDLFGNLSKDAPSLLTEETGFRLQSLVANQFNHWANRFFAGLFAGAQDEAVPPIETNKLTRALSFVKDIQSFAERLPADSAEKAAITALLLEATTALEQASLRAQANIHSKEPIQAAITNAYEATKQLAASRGPIASQQSQKAELTILLMEELAKGLPLAGEERAAASRQLEEAKVWSRELHVRRMVSLAASLLDKIETEHLDAEAISEMTADEATDASILADAALSDFETLPEVANARALLAKASQEKDDAAFLQPFKAGIAELIEQLLAKIPGLHKALETHRDTLRLRAAVAQVETAIEAVPELTAGNEDLVVTQQNAVVDALPAMLAAANTLTVAGATADDETPAAIQLTAAKALLVSADSQVAILATAKAKSTASLARMAAYDPATPHAEPDNEWITIEQDFHALDSIFTLALHAEVTDDAIFSDLNEVTRAYHLLSIAKLVHALKTSVESISLPAGSVPGSVATEASISQAEATIALAEADLGTKLSAAKEALHPCFDEEDEYAAATTDAALHVDTVRAAIAEAKQRLQAFRTQTRVPSPPTAASQQSTPALRTPALSTSSQSSYRTKTLFMETLGELSAFTTKIINLRTPVSSPAHAAPAPVPPKPRSELTTGAGTPIRIEKRVLTADEVIQSEAQFQVNDGKPTPAKVLLEQDASGKVSNKTKAEEYARLAEVQKEMVALRQAQMLVMNLDKKNPRKVTIRCDDLSEAQRLYAALLALGVADKNIRCTSVTLSRVGMFHWSSSVIKENLGDVLAVVSEMKKNLKAANKDITSSGTETAWEKQDEDEHYAPATPA